MAKIVTRNLAFATLSAIALLSPASARAPSGDDTHARCSKLAQSVCCYGNAADTFRERAFDACISNGGEMPR